MDNIYIHLDTLSPDVVLDLEIPLSPSHTTYVTPLHETTPQRLHPRLIVLRNPERLVASADPSINDHPARTTAIRTGTDAPNIPQAYSKPTQGTMVGKPTSTIKYSSSASMRTSMHFLYLSVCLIHIFVTPTEPGES